MASVADLKGQVILELLLLGLRVGDVCRLEWKWFDVSDQDAPVPLDIRTHKEGIIAHTFVSQELKELLTKFLPSLDSSCKYLLQSSRKEHLDEDSLNAILKDLATRARINLRGLLHWHCDRKLFMRTCAESGINSWNAKMMCGKAVEKSIETYINNVQLKEDIKKVSNILRLKKTNGNGRIGNLEEVMNLMGAALAELLRPIVARMSQDKQQSSKTLGLIINPDFEHMKPKKLLEEFLRLTKEE